MQTLPDCFGLGAFPTPLGCPCRAGDRHGGGGGNGVSPVVSKLKAVRARVRPTRRGARMLAGGGGSDGAGPGPGSVSNPEFGVKFGKGGTGRELYVVRRLANGVDFVDRLDQGRQQQQLPVVSGFTGFREDPMVDRLRDQIGMIHPIPVPPVPGSPAGLFVLFFFLGAMFDKLWTSASVSWKNRAEQEARSLGRAGVLPQVPTGFSMFLEEKDLQRKESVEWVNMVVGKLWKVYREGIENWIVGLLQPVIDDLEKPEYVERVEIKQFHLGEEPLSVRNVERKTSRQAHDLQYQIGLRYTGDARALLSLKLKFGIIPVVVPVGIRDFDIDGELWVKLRLIPSEPWIGAVSWAFVSLPKIKFELSPFRLFNIMAIPVLSMFLVKLLTEDLPLLFVRPKKIVLDFQKGQALYPAANDFLTKAVQEGNKDFVGELSVTLVDAKELFYLFFAKTDPYVILSLGDQTIRSKKNSQTTVIGPPGQPIWNQDFHLLVSNHKKQRLNIKIRDSLGLTGITDITIGTGEVDLQFLEDTVPTDRIVTLWGGWGIFGRGPTGKVLLRLTYKAYVEDEEDESRKMELVDGEISDDEMPTFGHNNTIYESRKNKNQQPTNESKFFMDVLTDLLLSEQFQGIVASETGTLSGSEDSRDQRTSLSRPYMPELDFSLVDSQKISQESLLLLCIAVITSIAVIICVNIGSSSFLSP